MCRGGNNLPRPDLIDFRLCNLYYKGTTAELSNKEPPVSEKTLTLGVYCMATGA
jgi:hypothetical protein